MEGFLYKTPKNTSPNGKNRLFLCAHNEDTEFYLKSFSKIVFPKFTNSAIWYYGMNDAPSDGEAEIFFENLSRMSVFIVAVTQKFLNDKDGYHRAAYDFARERNIPALIILQSKGLEEDFNKAFANRHYICLEDEDFEKKVLHFLSLLLVGKRLLSRVKRSFDTYLFLSYRKVDRKYAQRLMERIQMSFERVSIWYDDYLTAGENFNSEIRSALKGCDIMLMVVTPTLLIKPNYVWEKEYPLAVEPYHKQIIPFELVPTDKDQLPEDFPEIIELSRLSDNELKSFLSESFERYKHKTRLSDDERDYLLGLAYMLGITAKRDTAKGLDMIVRSAERGNYEAMNRLYISYRFGDSVEPDPKTAIEWKSKSFNALYRLYLKANHTSRRERLGAELLESAVELQDYANELIGQIYYDDPEYDEKFNYIFERSAQRQDVALALCFVADFLYDHANTERAFVALAKYELMLMNDSLSFNSTSGNINAENHYKKAIYALDQIPKKSSSAKLLTAQLYHAMARQNVSQSFKFRKSHKALYEEYSEKLPLYVAKAIEILEELYLSDNTNTEVSRELYSCYKLVADLLIEIENDTQKAREYLDRALAIVNELLLESETRTELLALKFLYGEILHYGIEVDESEADLMEAEIERINKLLFPEDY